MTRVLDEANRQGETVSAPLATVTMTERGFIASLELGAVEQLDATLGFTVAVVGAFGAEERVLCEGTWWGGTVVPVERTQYSRQPRFAWATTGPRPDSVRVRVRPTKRTRYAADVVLR